MNSFTPDDPDNPRAVLSDFIRLIVILSSLFSPNKKFTFLLDPSNKLIVLKLINFVRASISVK